LARIAERISDDQFWRTVRDVWLDPENAYEDRDRERKLWNTIWASARPYRERVMTAPEFAALKVLPNDVTIYRGTNDRASLRGAAWTLDRTKAIWYAHRWASKDRAPWLGETTVPKDRILAYFSAEYETIVLPKNCKNMRVRMLRLDKKR